MKSVFIKSKLLLVVACTCFIGVDAQFIAIPPSGIVRENFDAITTSLPAGWKRNITAGTALSAISFSTGGTASLVNSANSGTPTTGGSYNWGDASGTNRAPGHMTDGSWGSPNCIMANFGNSTGSTITQITVSYKLKRYRINTGTFSSQLYFSTTGNGTDWTPVPGGDVSTAVFTPGSSAYTFATPATIYKTATQTGFAMANNTSTIYLMWTFVSNGAATSGQGIGLDDVVIQAGTGAPIVSAGLGVSLTNDANSNGVANPGDKLTYKATIRNTGNSTATSTTYTNPAQPNTTATGAVRTSALANDDPSYLLSASGGNLSVPIGTGVLVNDFGQPSLTVASFGNSVSTGATVANGTNTAVSDNGATVTMNPNGSFTYNASGIPGFAGYDRFGYTATTGNAPDNDAIVTVAVGTPVSAVTDAYSVTGNVPINVSAPGVLSNDAGTNKAIIAVNGNAANVGSNTSTTHGTVNLAADGSFTYTPAAGYTGSDNFNYTIDNAFAAPSIGTVNLTVGNMIWFVDNSGSNGDGRLTTPFNNLASAASASSATSTAVPGQVIFVKNTGTNYTGGITLKNRQYLFGTGHTGGANLSNVLPFSLAANSSTLPAINGTRPVIVNSGGTGVLLASADTLRGFDIGNCSSFGISDNAASVGALTASDVSINNGTGGGFQIANSSGVLAVTLGSLSSTGGASVLKLTGNGGSFTVSGATTGTNNTSNAITLTSSQAGSSINLGAVTVNNCSADGIVISGNAGAINVSGLTTINAPSFAATSMDILNGTAASTVTFGNIDINGRKGNGLVISGTAGNITTGTLDIDNPNVNSNAAISITGATAGTISFGATTINGNNGSAGISLTNDNNPISFATGSNITNPGGAGFAVSGGSATVTYSGSITQATASQPLVSVTNGHSGTLTFNTGTLSATAGTGVQFSNAAGTYQFNGTTTLNGSLGGIYIVSSAGTFTFGSNTSITNTTGTGFLINGGSANVTYSGNMTQTANNAVMLQIQSSHSGTATFQTGTLNASTGIGLFFSTANGTYNFTGTTTLSGTTGILFQNGGSGTFDFGANTSVTNSSNTALTINSGAASAVNVTYRGSMTQTLNNDFLVDIREGHTGTITFPAGSSVNATAGPGLQFDNADGTYNFNGTNTLNGGDAAIDILNGSGGAFTFSSNTSITNPSGIAFQVGQFGSANSGGGGNITYNGTISKSSTGRIIEVYNRTGGTLGFVGSVTANGSSGGVLLSSNTGATIDFTGTLGLTTTSNTAFEANGAGTVGVSGSGSSILTTTGQGLVLSNVNAGAGGITFISVKSTSGQVANISTSTGTKTLGQISTSSGATTALSLTSAGTVHAGHSSLASTLTTSSTGISLTTTGTTDLVMDGVGVDVNATGSGTGVSCGGATVNISGGNLNITTASGTGFSATSGTVTLTGSNNTINTTSGTALDVTTTIGASGLTFQSISSSGGSANGIILSNTGSSGGLTVTGTGTAGSGGTIANKTGSDGSTSQGIGIYLNNTRKISLARMQLNDFQNFAIYGTNVTGLTISNCVVNGTNGNNAAFSEGSIVINGLFGNSAAGTANTITGSTIQGGWGDNVRVTNTTGTATADEFTVSASTISNTNTGTNGNDNLHIDTHGSANLNVHVNSGCSFSATNGDHIQTIADEQSKLAIVIIGNTFAGGGGANALGQGITISGGSVTGGTVESTETVRFHVSSNTMTGTIQGGAININEGVGAGNWQGKVSSNTIGNASAGSGASQSSGIRVENHSNGTLIAIVDTNTVKQWGSGSGIMFQAGDQGATGLTNGPLYITARANTVNTPYPAGFGDHGIQVNNGVQIGNTSFICADIKNNNSAANLAQGGVDYRLRQRMNTTISLPGYGGANNDNAAVNAYILARPNTAAGSGTCAAANNVAGGGGGFTNGGTGCTLPIVVN